LWESIAIWLESVYTVGEIFKEPLKTNQLMTGKNIKHIQIDKHTGRQTGRHIKLKIIFLGVLVIGDARNMIFFQIFDGIPILSFV